MLSHLKGSRLIEQMTPDERARDAIELVERVRARLAALRTIEHESAE
jgi:hypothetical protein